MDFSTNHISIARFRQCVIWVKLRYSLVGNKKVLEAVDADPTAFAKFTTFQGQYPNDTTVAVVVNGNLMRL